MRIAIVGTGAMGLLFTYLLSKEEGSDIWLLDIHPEREETIRKEGLFVEGVSGDHHVRPQITVKPENIGEADLVILCVKSPDTYEAARNATPLIGTDTGVLTLQNGLGNIESIEQAVGPGRAFGGTTSMGATVLAPNRIRHAGWGETIIGEPTGDKTQRAEAILETFRLAGLDVSFTDNLPGLLWSKLIINVGINALTALTRIHNGRLIDHEGTRTVMKMAVEEAAQVAQALGIRLALRPSCRQGGRGLRGNGGKHRVHAAGRSEREEDRDRADQRCCGPGSRQARNPHTRERNVAGAGQDARGELRRAYQGVTSHGHTDRSRNQTRTP